MVRMKEMKATRIIALRVSQEEFEQIEKAAVEMTQGVMSEYIRETLRAGGLKLGSPHWWVDSNGRTVGRT